MATIGTLSAILTLNSSRFSRGITRAIGSIRTFGSSVVRVTAKIGALGAALTGVASIGGLAVLTKGSMEAIDTTAKLATKLNTSTAAITGFQHAAVLSGASAETLNDAFDRMVKRVGEASLGTGEAVKALEVLRIDARTLMRMAPEEAFKTLADAIKGMGDQGVKSALAMKIMGDAGLRMVNTLDLGREGLERMQREAELLGLTFGGKAAAGIEQATDAMYRFRQILTAIGNRIAIAVAPAITAMNDRFMAFVKANGGLGPIIERWIEKAIMGVGKLVDLVLFLKGTIQRTFGELEKSLGRIMQTVAKITGSNNLQSMAYKTHYAGRRNVKAADESLLKFSQGAGSRMAQEWVDKFRKMVADKSKNSAPKKTFLEAMVGNINDVIRETGQKLPGLADKIAAWAAPIAQRTKEFRERQREPGSFAQIVRSRTAFGGPKKQRQPVDVDAETKEILMQIADALKFGAPARTV